MRKAVGVTVKISGNCDLVDKVSELLEHHCDVLHKSRVRHHEKDDGSHIYFDITELKLIE